MKQEELAQQKVAQKLKKPIPVTLEQFRCVLCEKMFYINKDDIKEEQNLVCPFCNDNNVPNIRQFDVEILAILDKQ